MGILIDRIKELKSDYDYINYNSDTIPEKIEDANRKAVNTVFESFDLLRPFSTSHHKVTPELAVGTQLRGNLTYSKYGYFIRYPRTFFEEIRGNGRLIIPFIRKAIKGTFTELVSLTEQLKEIEHKKVEIPFDKPINYLETKSPIEIIEINPTSLIWDPYSYNSIQVLSKGGIHRLYFNNVEHWPALEGLAFTIRKAFEDFNKNLDEEIAYNQKILDQIEDKVAIYKIAKNMHS